MNSNPNTVSVSILDKEYQVACPVEQQPELLKSAQHLDQQMRAIRSTGKVIGLERIAVMAALNISHELLQARSGIAAEPKAPAPKTGDSGGATAADGDAISGLNSKLDEALHQLRQLEIG